MPNKSPQMNYDNIISGLPPKSKLNYDNSAIMPHKSPQMNDDDECNSSDSDYLFMETRKNKKQKLSNEELFSDDDEQQDIVNYQ